MILEMDVGNTLCKWRLLGHDGALLARDALPANRFLSDPDPLLGASPARIRVACVAGPELRHALAARLHELTGCAAEFAQSTAECAGVRNSYPEPHRLGVDRWLAMLSAWARVHGPVIVVDAGTAVTVDVLDGRGHHRGGYIMPGQSLLYRALARDTREVGFGGERIPESLDPGTDTEGAVSAGVLLMLASAVDAAIGRACGVLGAQCPVLLCGGDAGIMKQHLPLGLEHVPDLVLDGLALALP